MELSSGGQAFIDQGAGGGGVVASSTLALQRHPHYVLVASFDTIVSSGWEALPQLFAPQEHQADIRCTHICGNHEWQVSASARP